jgi:hypothetical protein
LLVGFRFIPLCTLHNPPDLSSVCLCVILLQPQPEDEDKVRRLSTAMVRPPTSQRPRTALPHPTIQRPVSALSTGSATQDVHDSLDSEEEPAAAPYRPKTPQGPPPSHLPPLARSFTPTAPPPSHLPPLTGVENAAYVDGEAASVRIKKKKRQKQCTQNIPNPAYAGDYQTPKEGDREMEKHDYTLPVSPPPVYISD